MLASRTLIVLALTCFAAVPGAAHAQEPGSASTPAEITEPVQRWLEVFNNGDFAAMEAFYAPAAASDPEARQRLLRQYEMYLVTRGLESVTPEPSGKNRQLLRGIERLSGDPANIILDVSGEVPVLDGLRMVRTPDDASSRTKLSESDMIKDLDAQITHRAEADEFSGAVLIAKDGETIFKKAWGVSDKSSGASNRTDTKFNLASCGKMFTAVAVLQLVQAGQLSLDDTVGKILPDYNNEDVRNKVTVRQLLSHTSGMGDIFTEEFRHRRTEIRSVADWVSLFETEPLTFEPGTQWAYSNAGFCLLGAIVEKVSGQNYYAYLDEHTFKPAGMINTGAFETDKPVENLAIGYTRMGATSPEQLRDRIRNTDIHSVKGSPAGGSYSTVEDLANFAAALLGHKLLNEEYTQLAVTPQFQNVRNADPYGMGFGVEDINGHTVVGHGGGFPGISTSFDMFPDDGYVVVVMSNYDMVARRYSMQLREWITAQ